MKISIVSLCRELIMWTLVTIICILGLLVSVFFVLPVCALGSLLQGEEANDE